MSASEAVIEAPEVHANPAETNVGDVYSAALEKAQGDTGESPKPKAESPAAPEPEPAAEPPDPTPPAKPTSALEAALAEPEKKEEPAADADPLKDLPETLPNQDRGQQWAKARSLIKTLFEHKTQAENTIAELQSKADKPGQIDPAVTVEIESLKKENARLRDGITAANVELLPDFQEKYVQQPKALVANALEKAKAYGGDAEALEMALALPEGKRRDAAIHEALGEEFSEIGRTKINNIVAQIDSLREEAGKARENAQQTYEKSLADRQAERAAQEQEIEGRKQATFDAVTKRLQAEVPTLRNVDAALTGGDEWNTGVRQAFEKAQALFGNDAKAEDTVAAAIKGSDYDRVTGLLTASWKENGDLRKQLAELQGAQPDVHGRTPKPKTSKDALLEQDPGDIYKQTVEKAQGGDD